MFGGLDSSGDEGEGLANQGPSGNRNTRQVASRGMRSMFAEDDMQSRQGVTSLRYEDKGTDKAVARSVMGSGGATGQQSNASSPLQTAVQAVVVAYKGEEVIGSCVVAACVPRTSATAPPLIAIIDRDKRPQCRVRMDENLQLIQSEGEPQYASLFDPSFGGHWSLMFKGRRECTEFVASVLTALNSSRLQDSGVTPPIVEWGSGASPYEELGAAARTVTRGDTVTISFTSWLLQRVPGTSFFSLGKVIEEVPPEAPREVSVGSGTMMIGVENALTGMREGGFSRLVFVTPRLTKVNRGLGNPEVQPSDTVVTHITCHEILRAVGRNKASRPAHQVGTVEADNVNSAFDNTTAALGAPAVISDRRECPPGSVETGAAQTGSSDVNSLMQVLLLQTLQQQQQQKQSVSAPVAEGGQLSSIERSVERLHLQIATLYEKVDRLGIDEKIEKNNAAIERIVKKVVGKVPMGEVDLEDAVKDRDGLLATIERLKGRLEEETSNYHRALEAMSRHKDEVLQLQKDLQLQQETHGARVQQLEEDRRLRLVEAHVQQQQAVERVGEEKFREGYEAGVRATEQKHKEQRALDPAATDGCTTQEWKDRLFASEQRAVQLETALQQAEGRHIAERRQLQEHVDALTRMTTMLQERAEAKASAVEILDGQQTAEQQSAFLRRTMNSVYVNLETQLRAMGSDTVSVLDVLHLLSSVTAAEVSAFSDDASKEALLQWNPAVSANSDPMELHSTQVANYLQDASEMRAGGTEGTSDTLGSVGYAHISGIDQPPVVHDETGQLGVPPPPEGESLFAFNSDVDGFPEPPNLLIDAEDGNDAAGGGVDNVRNPGEIFLEGAPRVTDGDD
ncbi:hypothetical protein, conserved [Trypanosoma brucei gambiense DAL972]|uniref:peptidylprolyl isomerase n=1 Tax=Trypanosoma brucei gambiense (strain MHOM/CI/86/DAL972) TaxID=679716 RepID=D0A6H9_TRYB9|nr:hypothetical protein, conserved [Trypanosoma brucei gambiense DAL972]CBH17280.1 hypothetical protein, conserved [Trypanosoma brucei gambiense DAL972]|eukprot:XP_011779544.1 hypothetical protein, conserved [Trypanosoma brucei gambiense DAL972]